eukprot:3558636-Rhodomonas_salina.1
MAYLPIQQSTPHLIPMKCHCSSPSPIIAYRLQPFVYCSVRGDGGGDASGVLTRIARSVSACLCLSLCLCLPRPPSLLVSLPPSLPPNVNPSVPHPLVRSVGCRSTLSWSR